MHVRYAAPAVTVFAPAKLNLFLEIVRKRADGFHELETLMVPVALWDTLHLLPDAAGKISCRCLWHGSRSAAHLAPVPELPEDDANLAVRAVRRLREVAGVAAGAKLQLIKRIPIAAGLAGGSSDAAAALVAANLAWGINWPAERLAPIAAELGSDVAFFLGHLPAVCRGRGEIIEPQPGLAPLHFVVVQPPAGLSTAAVYAQCRPAAEPQTAARLVSAWRAGRWAELRPALLNRLEAAAEMITPWIERMRREFARFDFLGHQMTGSGSAYFGICRHARHARHLAGALRARGFSQALAVSGLT